jgi:hypothetical protein
LQVTDFTNSSYLASVDFFADNNCESGLLGTVENIMEDNCNIMQTGTEKANAFVCYMSDGTYKPPFVTPPF